MTDISSVILMLLREYLEVCTLATPTDSVASSLQATAFDLEKKLAADHLKHDLEKRHTREELVERKSIPARVQESILIHSVGNILPESTAAPALVGQQKELAKNMRRDSLNEKLAHRPDPETLLKDGVLREDPRSPETKAADALYEESIEDEYAKREGGA